MPAGAFAEPPSCRAARFDPGGAAEGDPVLGSPAAALGTALTRAGPRATGLSRRCAGRPEVFNVPRGPARRLRVGATRGRGVSRVPAVGALGPGGSAPVRGPLLRTGLTWLGGGAGGRAFLKFRIFTHCKCT